jgi:aminoglycoside phosphotransferase
MNSESYGLAKVLGSLTEIFGRVEVIKKYRATLNNVYLVKSGREKYILKIAMSKIRSTELHREIELLKSLAGIMEVPSVVISGELERSSWVLMEYIDGEKVDRFSQPLLGKLGRILRILHDCETYGEVDYVSLLRRARDNMTSGRLDKEEFFVDDRYVEPQQLWNWLDENRPTGVRAKLLHGDFRPKNMILKGGEVYLIDFGLSFVGDEYYDLAVFKYYLSEEEFKVFYQSYGINEIDAEHLEYNEVLSKFLNV